MKSNFPSLIVEQINNLTRIQNQAGCQIDPLVPSIQTVGTKTKGFIYADNNQPNTAWTIKSDYVGDSTEIVINDASVFERIDMKDILGKLQNLNAFIKTHVFTKGLSTLKINEYESFYYYEFKGDGIAASQTLIVNFDGLSIKTPSVGYFNLPSISGNGNTVAQWTRCYSDSFRVLAGSNGLSPTTYSGGYIPKL